MLCKSTSRLFQTIAITAVLGMLLSSLVSHAQAPEMFNYQTVVRDSGGAPLANQPMNIRVSVLSDSSTGTVVFQEMHTVFSNDYGMVNLKIGGGNSTVGSLGAANWDTAPHFIKAEIETFGTSGFEDVSNTQLLLSLIHI